MEMKMRAPSNITLRKTGPDVIIETIGKLAGKRAAPPVPEAGPPKRRRLTDIPMDEETLEHEARKYGFEKTGTWVGFEHYEQSTKFKRDYAYRLVQAEIDKTKAGAETEAKAEVDKGKDKVKAEMDAPVKMDGPAKMDGSAKMDGTAKMDAPAKA